MNQLHLLLLVMGVLLLAWYFLSQFIAWMITPRLDRTEEAYHEAVISMWWCVFFAPLFAVWIFVAWLDQRRARTAKFYGLPVEPSESGGDYIL